MQTGRSRRIAVPTDTQPQFDLGDTAEDIEGRREKEERERRGRDKSRMRGRERSWNGRS